MQGQAHPLVQLPFFPFSFISQVITGEPKPIANMYQQIYCKELAYVIGQIIFDYLGKFKIHRADLWEGQVGTLPHRLKPLPSGRISSGKAHFCSQSLRELKQVRLDYPG